MANFLKTRMFLKTLRTSKEIMRRYSAPSSVCELQSSTARWPSEHTPVMATEVVNILDLKPNQVVLDMTFGSGGHTKALLQQEPSLRVIAFDRDPYAFHIAKELAKRHCNILPAKGKFSEVEEVLGGLGFVPGSVDAVLIDAGVSSMQFNDERRGFGVSKNGPLDMRMDPEEQRVTAADVVNFADESSLYKILKYYGEEKRARHIAQAVVDHRNAHGHFYTTQQLKELAELVFQSTHRRDKLMRPTHVATKIFQGLRVFINNELNELHNGLEQAHHLLKEGGRCAVISFHSLEDRIVKRQFHNIDMDSKINASIADKVRNRQVYIIAEQDMNVIMRKNWEPLTKGVQEPSVEEIQVNPRSRSAKLRGATKLCPSL